ncbi:MAG TPA: MFS transporter [Planctomycetota bacterium]
MEAQVVRKISWRILPLIWICYVAAFIDRVNVSFAAEAFKTDLGFNADVFGAGAGIFFIGYFLFEVPSNVILHKVGARVWIARIMIVWGLVSTSMIFIQGKGSFYALRFLLGAAEAGYFPGMILYLTYWFPSAYRSRTIGLFMTAPAVAEIIGGPLSGFLLDHPCFGVKGWQWLFLVEGLPSVVLGLAVLALLPDGPGRVSWLTPAEKDWLSARLESERRDVPKLGFFEALRHPRVLVLCLLCFLLCTGGYGLGMFLPQVLRGAFPSVSNTQLGFLTAIPSLIAAVVMILWARHSDRRGERRWHVAIPAWIAAVGLATSSLGVAPALAVVCMTAGVSGRWASNPPFWALPTTFLSGTAAAGGIALINSIGNLGGYAGPRLMGALQVWTGTHAAGLRLMSFALLAAGLLALALRLRPSPQPTPAALPTPARSHPTPIETA